MAAVRVALLNDYEIVLRGLEALLAKYTDSVEVVASAVGPELREVVVYTRRSASPVVRKR